MLDRTRQRCCCCDVCFRPIKILSLEWTKNVIFSRKVSSLFLTPNRRGEDSNLSFHFSVPKWPAVIWKFIYDPSDEGLPRTKIVHQTSQMWASLLGKRRPQSWLSSHIIIVGQSVWCNLSQHCCGLWGPDDFICRYRMSIHISGFACPGEDQLLLQWCYGCLCCSFLCHRQSMGRPDDLCASICNLALGLRLKSAV